MLGELEVKILDMMENDLINRSHVLLEDNFLMGTKNEDCNIDEWINDDVMTKSKVSKMLSKMEKPEDIPIHKCGSGEIIKLGQYKQMAKHNDPNEKENVIALARGLSYISKATFKFLRSSPEFGSNIKGLDDETNARDILEFFAKKDNFIKLTNLISQRDGREVKQLQQFVNSIGGTHEGLRDKIADGLEEEPALRYILSLNIKDYQRKFGRKALISFSGQGPIRRSRRALSKNPYKFFHENVSRNPFKDKGTKLSDFANESRKKHCMTLEEDFKRFKKLRTLLKSGHKLLTVKTKPHSYSVGTDLVNKLRKNNVTKRLATRLDSMLTAALDRYTNENKINAQKDNEKKYHMLARSKCELNSDYTKLLSSQLPMETELDSHIDRPIDDVNINSVENPSRFTHWGQIYCSNPGKANDNAKNYQQNKSNWISSHCSLKSCDLDPQSSASNDVIAEKTRERGSTSVYSDKNYKSLGSANGATYSDFKHYADKTSKNTKRGDERSPEGRTRLVKSDSINSTKNNNNSNSIIKGLQEKVDGYKERRNQLLKQQLRGPASQAAFDESSINRDRYRDDRYNRVLGNSNQPGNLKNDTYLNKSDRSIQNSALASLSKLDSVQSSDLINQVGGNIEFLSSEGISLAIDSRISQNLSASDIYDKFSDIDKAKIKELLKSGLPVEIMDKEGHTWRAEKGSRRYKELIAAINNEISKLSEKIVEDINPPINKERLRYLELLRLSQKVLNSN